MDHYITGNTIKELREKRNMTQKELADALGVSDKTVSKWETGKGYPDITMLEPLSEVLRTSVAGLLTGEYRTNRNQSSNLLRSCFYVCPVCGNVVHTTGETLVSCCGITLPVLEAEVSEGEHEILTEQMDGECYISVEHEMKKAHYISFIAFVSSDKFEMKKLYPEQSAEARFRLRGHGNIFVYCNRHGLMKKRV